MWEAWANPEELCAGTFVPSAPGRRLNNFWEEKGLDPANGRNCAFHARCEACHGTANEEYCDEVMLPP